LVGKVLRLLRTRFDYVVVDTAPSFDEHVLQAIDETDELLLVTTLDVPTLKNVKIAVETLDLLNFPREHRRLVLNRADDKVGLAPDKVESTLGMQIAASIPTSPQVASATNSGEPILASLPRHAVSKAVMALAEDLAGSSSEQASKTEHSGHAAAAPKRSLLRRNSR
jgi:pilus assembly protein CpaE